MHADVKLKRYKKYDKQKMKKTGRMRRCLIKILHQNPLVAFLTNKNNKISCEAEFVKGTGGIHSIFRPSARFDWFTTVLRIIYLLPVKFSII
jgi:hypothetical protein